MPSLQPSSRIHAEKPKRLWTTACISTGRLVQKRALLEDAPFYPTTVQLGYNLFQSGLQRPKPLIL
jgi:hypothetical protein